MVMLTQTQPATANVPTNNPGVPATLSPASAIQATASVDLATLVQSALVERQDAQWGIFFGGAAVFTSGRVRAVELQQHYRKTDAPVENGSFLSYNKVRVPRQVMVEMLCDGSSFSASNAFGGLSAVTGILSTLTGTPSGAQIVRGQFLALLDNLVTDLNVYQITTPERTYPSMNVVGYTFRRASERGVTLLYADILTEEVRLIAASQYTATAQPQGEPQQDAGNVQSAYVTPGQIHQYALAPIQ